VFMITGNSGLQLATRPEMRGRVMAIYSIVFLGGTPIGAPLTGVVAEHIGPRAAMAGAGAIAVLAGAVTLRYLRRRAIAENTGEVEGAGEAFSTVDA
jgi:predicted MFS family arabinose efflux permease